MTSTPRPAQARAVRPTERLDRDGEALLLVGSSVVRLSALAVVAVDACGSGWTGLTELTAVLVDRFGSPPGPADTATLSLVRALADEGVLELR